MERGDNNINIGIIPTIIPTTNNNMNSSSSATLGLDMRLTSPPPHLSFQQGPAGPIRHHHSTSPFSPYSVPRSRQPTAIDSDEHDVVSKRPVSTSQVQNQQNQQGANCPWARMKWTEGMVRLLISEVYRVGDDGGGVSTEGADHHTGPSTKGANRTSGAAKGKWKSVSKAMIDKGFYVSPQQCEDKFNDLNKRYKRVIDLLGKGTACRVVETPTMLDSMELAPKAKEEARKLLNSKHLFFPEMCAYHNAGNVSSVHPSSSQMNNLSSDQQQCMHHQAGQAQTTVHPPGNNRQTAQAYPNSDEEDQDNSTDNESSDSSEKEEEYDSDYYEAGNQVGGSKKQRLAKHHSANSPPLSLSLSSTSGGGTAVQQLKNEMMSVISTGGDGVKQWMKRRSTELEEQRVGYQMRAYQLERQRFKWLRYSTNKEREMERKRLHNDRLRLENERMLLLLRQKELELGGNANENFGTGTSGGIGMDQIQFQQQGYMHK